MVVWAPIEDNPWLSFARTIVGQHLGLAEPAEPEGPGPFAMSDPAVVTEILTRAGYTGVSLERTSATVRVGESIDEALGFQLSIGPAAALLRDAPEAAERERAAIKADLRAMLAQHARPDGVWMDTSSWAVSAQAP
jgi:hypothetical protein